jgi:hypothetical protein
MLGGVPFTILATLVAPTAKSRATKGTEKALLLSKSLTTSAVFEMGLPTDTPPSAVILPLFVFA